MKTIKIILSIAGFAFTSICFGQLLSQNKSDVLFYSAHYNLASNRMEHQVDNYPARTTSGDHFEAPVSSRTYFAPFESSVYEEKLQIESWMLTPFESNYYELDPIIEQWMTAPFESGEEIEIEAWMSTIWI
jgi:hypothetical protein